MSKQIKVTVGQVAALNTYCFESIHDEERPAGLSLVSRTLTVACPVGEAFLFITDAANSADDSGDAQWCRVLTAVARAVLS